MSNNKTKNAGVLAALRAMLWSFFGIREQREFEADLSQLRIGQVVAAGVIGVVLFIAILVAIVYFVTK